MYLIIIGMVAGIVIGAWTANNFWRRLLGIIIGWFLGIFVGCIFAALVGGIGHNIFPEKITEGTGTITYLKVLQDNSTISGSFFLGFGSFDGNMYYSFYEKIGDNEYKLSKLDVDDVTIKYILDDSKPRIETIERKWKTNWGIWDGLRKVIFVPEGSIKGGFTLDAK